VFIEARYKYHDMRIESFYMDQLLKCRKGIDYCFDISKRGNICFGLTSTECSVILDSSTAEINRIGEALPGETLVDDTIEQILEDLG